MGSLIKWMVYAQWYKVLEVWKEWSLLAEAGPRTWTTSGMQGPTDKKRWLQSLEAITVGIEDDDENEITHEAQSEKRR